MKRIVLFMITNFAVMATIMLLIHLLGVGRYMSGAGINYYQLAGLCLIWGMAGSLVSLAISRFSAKMAMGVQVISRSDPHYGGIVRMVEDLSRKAGLPVVPEVGVYQSPEVNAFATGPSKRRSLVAFSTGLLNSMNQNEIEGVAAHELAHISNGDMVTMTLLQGVINAFVMFFARIIAFAISQSSRERDERSYGSNYMVVYLLEIVLGLFGMMVVAWFSRWREFRADRGGAAYAGKNDMISALERLRMNTQRYDDQPAMAAFKISGGGFLTLFSTHPPLEKRIKALREMAL